MKTEEEIKERIKQEVQFGWKHGDKESRKRITSFCNGLLWALYGYQNVDFCPYCGASEIHPDDTLPLDEDEQETGYYKNRLSPIANQTDEGKLVNHKKALQLYPLGLLKNCKPSYFQQGVGYD